MLHGQGASMALPIWTKYMVKVLGDKSLGYDEQDVYKRQEYGCIGLCTGVRLYVGPFCAEDLFQAVDGNLLTLVHYLTTTIVTLAGVSFTENAKQRDFKAEFS